MSKPIRSKSIYAVVTIIILTLIMYFSFREHGSNSDIRDFVESHMKAESQIDFRLRCKTIPYPPGATWKKETIDAFCDDVFTPTLLPADVYSLIESGKGAELDVKYDDILAAYLEGRIPEGAMLNAYSNSFGGSSSQKKRLIKQWLSASPNSPHALTARGKLYSISAWEHRGNEYVSETPKDQLANMRQDVELAINDLKAAIALNPKQIPAYYELIGVSRLIGRKDIATEYLKKLQLVDPYNYYALYSYALHFEPRWGGSRKEMASISNNAQSIFSKNPRVTNLIAWNTFYPSISLHLDKKYAESEPLFDQAFKQSPHSQLMLMYSYSTIMSGNNAKSIELHSERLRFDPNDASIYIARANSLMNLSLHDLARQDINKARSIYPNYAPAISSGITLDLRENKINDAQQKLIEILNMEPSNEWALESIIWLTIFKTQDENLGREMVAKALKVNPKNSVFWWLNWEIARRTHSKDLKEATQQFIENANKNDPRQVDALKYVEA